MKHRHLLPLAKNTHTDISISGDIKKEKKKQKANNTEKQKRMLFNAGPVSI